MHHTQPKRTNPPGTCITTWCSNVQANHPVFPQRKMDPNDRNVISSQHSSESTFRRFQNGKDITSPAEKQKTLKTELIQSYNSDGLPVQLMIHADDDTDEPSRIMLSQFIYDYVVDKIDKWSEQLSKTNEAPEKLYTKWIRKLYKKLEEKSTFGRFPFEFTLSLAMCYSKQTPSPHSKKKTPTETLYCAGFGIGNNGVLLKETDGTIHQLVRKTLTNGKEDGFNYESYTTAEDILEEVEYADSVNTVIKRADTFHRKINAGDEIVLFSHAANGLYIEEPNKTKVQAFQYDSPKRGSRAAQSVVNISQKYALDTAKLKGKTLFDAFRNANADQLEIDAKEVQAGSGTLGGDFTVGAMTVPIIRTRILLQNQIRTQENKRLSNEKNTFSPPITAQVDREISCLLNEGEKKANDPQNQFDTQEQARIIRSYTSTYRLGRSGKLLYSNPTQDNHNQFDLYYQKHESISKEMRRSKKMKILGGILMGLGVLFLIPSTLCLLASLSVLPSGIFTPLAAVGVVLSSILIGLSGAMFALGASCYGLGKNPHWYSLFTKLCSCRSTKTEEYTTMPIFK